MLDKVIQELSISYTLTETSGIFLSLFDEKWELITSQWTLQTTKTMEQLVPVLYNALIWSDVITSIVVDVVKDIVEQTDKEVFSWLDMSLSGICIIGDGQSGVLLPGTTWIQSSKDALTALKKKYNVAGKVRLYSFTTDRIIVH